MPLIKKRTLKLKWRLILSILPIAIIPLAFIVWFISARIFNHLEKQKLILNETLIFQVAQNIDKVYQDYANKIPQLIEPSEISGNIYRKSFADQTEFKYIDDEVAGASGSNLGLRHLSVVLNIPGVTHIVNKSLYNPKDDTYFTYWRGANMNISPNLGVLIEKDPMFLDSVKDIERQFRETGVKSAASVKMGRLSRDTFLEYDKWTSMIWPVMNEKSSPDPDSADFNVFVLLLLTNEGESGFLPKTVLNISGINQGTLFILDYKNETMYSNWAGKMIEPEYDNDPEYGIYTNLITADYEILNEQIVMDVLNNTVDESKVVTSDFGKHFDISHNEKRIELINDKEVEKRYNNRYQTIIIDTNYFSDMKCGVKLVYFYPKELIYQPIYVILIQIFFITLVIVVIIVVISIFISNSLAYPLITLDYATNKVSQGYLDVEIISESKDEIGRLYRNFRRMLSTINEVLSNIQKSSNNLVGYQNTLDRVVTDFDTTIKKQAASISESSAIFEQLNFSIKQVAQNVKASLNLAEKAKDQSRNSNQIITDMVSEINKIADNSKEINFITELINNISEKTRLLSLNAAIEASRAGEAGKGFNVVASEIRKLALQSNEAANDIGELIKMNEKRIKAGVDKTSEALEALNKINESIEDITNIVGEINTATEEESKGSQVIMDIINSFSEEANKNIKSTEAIGRTRNQLSVEVDKMKNLVVAFKLQSGEKEIVRDIKMVTSEDKKRIRRERELKRKERLEKKSIERQLKYDEKYKKKNVSESDLGLEKRTSKKGKIFKGVNDSFLTKRKNVKIPNKVKSDLFFNKYISKITKEEDRNYFLSKYKKDDYNDKYILMSNLLEGEKLRLKNIISGL
ncbi:MAG TPA: HAMP domain-containing methyl-accepting chemotaxis protein [Spirochaetota bacterium]|nr:MAG: Methyl-accepting chemotaxis protein III [Spirochaetes bacterium ADurb.Bin133]HNZ26511.1 HAMP domain-containing methyl-accepting chemotaxis protein [Spirochaetota bacterium]HPY86698.1 HAMP domain-containing methyl-accepting chemotaxis protein [Spirochaetota bacterium]